MQVLTKDILEGLYIKEKISTTIIGKKYGYHNATIFRKLKKHNIPIWARGTFLEDIKFSEEHKNNISKMKKGKPTANQFKLGHSPTKGNKGMKGLWHCSDKHKKILSELMKGNTHTLGYHHSNETKKKIGKSGVKHWNWKGGISDLNTRIRQTSKCKEWRLMVFGRDNYTCQRCGRRGTYLEAHHIKSFSSLIQYYEITTLNEALKCKELFNVNNGITLCEKCHKIITNNNLKRDTNGMFIQGTME